MIKWFKWIMGGIGCALLWYGMDHFIWHKDYDSDYYIAVVSAYVTGAWCQT